MKTTDKNKAMQQATTKYPSWQITFSNDAVMKKIRNPVLIQGLPGIGNVGKIVIDLLVDQLKAEKIIEFFSYELPNSVFVQENSLVSLPRLELYYKKVGNDDFVFLSGDVQPMTEQASYQFCELVLDIVQQWKCRQVITLGGIGLAEIPEDPKLYITGTRQDEVDEFSKGLNLQKKLYGVVGPVIGITGILIGLSGKRKISACCILAETFGHQLYLGLVGARKIVALLSKKYSFKASLDQLDKEIDKFQIQLKDENAVEQISKRKGSEVNYIG